MVQLHTTSAGNLYITNNVNSPRPDNVLLLVSDRGAPRELSPVKHVLLGDAILFILAGARGIGSPDSPITQALASAVVIKPTWVVRRCFLFFK